MSTNRPIPLYRGTTAPDLVWRLMSAGQPFDGTGSVFTLTIKTGDGIIRKSTLAGQGLTFEASTGRLRWHRTIAESEMFGVSQTSEYAIGRNVGEDRYLVARGTIIGERGLGDG